MFDLFKIAHAGVISDAPRLSDIILNFLTFLLQIFGILAIISIVISGTMLFFSSGSEEQAKKAKKSIAYSIIGMLIAGGGMLIIRTIAGIFK